MLSAQGSDERHCAAEDASDSRLKTQLEPHAQVRYRKDNYYGFAFSGIGPIEQANVRQLCGKLMSA
jgi:hypothetical protein